MSITLSRATTPEQRLRIAPQDRLWVDSASVVCLLGPLRGLDPAAVIDAVRRLAEAGVGTRVGLVTDPDRRHWRYQQHLSTEQAAQLVSVEEPSSYEDADEFARRAAGYADASHPLHVVLAGEWIALVNKHSLGDGFQTMQVISAIVSLAQGGPLPEWTAQPSLAWPVTRAVLHTFARKPGNAIAIARGRLGAGASAVPPDQAQSPVAPPVAWSPAARVASARTTGAAHAELKAWRREHAPDASMAAVTLSLLRRGLMQSGLALDPVTSTAINARRYLPARSVVHGNFASRLDLSPQAADNPVALTQALAGAVDSGRPLASMTASILASRLRHGAGVGAVACTMQPGLPAHVGYSYFGRHPGIDRLEWAADPDGRRIVAGVDPAQPHEVGWCVFIVGGGLQMSAAYHATVYEPELIESMLARVCADPVAVMDGRP